MCLKSIRKQRIAFVQLPHRVRSSSFSGSIQRSTTLLSPVLIRNGMRNSSENSMLSASRMWSQRKAVSASIASSSSPNCFSPSFHCGTYAFLRPRSNTSLWAPRSTNASIRRYQQPYLRARNCRPTSRCPRPTATSSQATSAPSLRRPMAMPCTQARLSSTRMSRKRCRTLMRERSSRRALERRRSNLVLSDFSSTLLVLRSILLMPSQNFSSSASSWQNCSLSCADASRNCATSASTAAASASSSRTAASPARTCAPSPSACPRSSSRSSKELSNSLKQMNRSSSARASCISSWICASRHRPHSASSSPTRAIASSVSSSKLTSPRQSLQHTRWQRLHSMKNSLARPCPRPPWPSDFIINLCRVAQIVRQYNCWLEMKFCTHCRQYHSRAEEHAHNCFTYEKFTYLLKDEFLRWNREEQKLPKQPQLSPAPPKKRREGAESSFKQAQAGRYYQGQEGALNRRIEKVISKSRGCREHRKDCSHMRSTSCDEHQSSAEEAPDDCPLDCPLEHETEMELTIIPCERLFEKPFNSRLLSNPVVYDSLWDNRLCGMDFCEEGEVEAGSLSLRRT